MPLRGRRIELAGAVVLLTGASDGIGAACAAELRKRGARLSLTGRSAEKLAKVAGPEDLVTAADLAAEDTPGLLVRRTLERWGRVDVLINNAGSGIYWPAAESPIEETRAMFEVNLYAPLRLAQAVIPHMRETGAGAIVNVGSIAGRVALPWMPLYSASKAALGMVTGSLRRELRGEGIRVMLVEPGYVLTEFQAHSVGLEPPRRVVDDKKFAITPAECARDIVRGLERGARVVMTPRWGWFLWGAHRLAPRVVESHLAHLNQPVGRA